LQEKDIFFHEDLVEEIFHQVRLRTGKTGYTDHGEHSDQEFVLIRENNSIEALEYFFVGHGVMGYSEK
jgi:hypothetical protein